MRIAGFEFRPTTWPTVATIAVLPVLIWLGFWQLGRAEVKQSRLERLAERRDAPPLALEQLSPGALDPQELRFRPVRARGRFLASRQYLLDNRTRAGVAGYHVLTPLVLADGGRAVIVDRGWVPVGESRERLPAIGVSGDAATIAGRAVPPSGGGLLLGPDGYGSPGWPKVVQTVDLGVIGEQIGHAVLPVLVELDPASPSGYVREWRPYGGFGPERHLGYAVQWFALALTLVVIYVVLNTRRAR